MGHLHEGLRPLPLLPPPAATRCTRFHCSRSCPTFVLRERCLQFCCCCCCRYACDTASPGKMNDEERDMGVEAERRAHHSALERRRRDQIKFTFDCLRDAVPSLQWERATRAQILKRATDYIQLMQRRNRERLHTIKDLKREKKHLEDQIRAFGGEGDAQRRWRLPA
ncbi:hypothetical protein HPB49_001233 [Dermacentor silvarum]|uniref:Uncharacterized protein n=1 Tax=Dermacentor silvarum TaxID=543639 RepID=A0ACB8CIV9_DERSI|nr:hypothetical protein HPB49_001233 [Dermacentor silvarum]